MTGRPGYRVRRVPVERTLALRKAVLRPHLGPEEPFVCPDDHLPETFAVGALTAQQELIGVARITPQAPPFPVSGARAWRLRGMAARPEVRGRGVGTALLAALVEHVAATGGGVLWCNARVSALGLYERGGMRRFGAVWEEPEIGPHVVMWRTVAALSPVVAGPDPGAAPEPRGGPSPGSAAPPADP
ncbi:MAG TPA: GNAT family N-acetyltransferase [Solirubrobacteraceae bacterium]|nr:GNAT family N-acetyltransferase [Solirubrobacteraceae bacterium]